MVVGVYVIVVALATIVVSRSSDSTTKSSMGCYSLLGMICVDDISKWSISHKISKWPSKAFAFH